MLNILKFKWSGWRGVAAGRGGGSKVYRGWDSATSRWARNLLSSSNAVQIYMKTFAKMREFPFAENQFDFGECETVYIFSSQSVGCTSDM